jgi:DNA-binding GntR family transcriptional regulator
MEATSLGGDGRALSALPPRDASALVRTVRDRLRLAITLQEIPPGTRLNQVQVAAQLGVSRMPVRTAIADLITEGLLEPLRNGGAAVRSLTDRDVREVYEVRTALEAQAVLDVAQRRPPAGLEQIAAILDRHARLGGANDAAALLELDREFHMTILDATENAYFRRAMVPIWFVVERAMVGMLRSIPTMFERAWEQHAEIAEALHAGDARLAEARLRSHLEYSVAQLATVMSGSNPAESSAGQGDAATA